MDIREGMQHAAAIFRRNTRLVLQTEAAECGLACLAMIAGRYGHRVDLPALRQRYSLSFRGSTLQDLVRIASDMRLATRALRAGLPHLRRLRLPCILHWDHNHFVVLAKVGRHRAVILDPAVGRRQVPLQEVDNRFTGVVLEAWPTESFERKTERARVGIWKLLRRTDGFASAASRILIMSLVLEAIGVMIPIGFQLVLDDVVVSNDLDLLTLIALGIGLVLAFRALIDFVRSWAIMAASSSLTLYWKMSLFRHLFRLPLSFFERRHAGDVASRFISIDKIQQTLSTSSISPVVDGVMAVVLVGMMWLYAPLLTIVACVMTVIYGLMRGVAYSLYRRANEEAVVYAAYENSHFLESLHGMASIKALAIGDRRQGVWNNYLVDRVGTELRVSKIDMIFTIASNFLFGMDRILIIFLGARAVIGGDLSVGMLVAFLAYKDQFSLRVAKCLDTVVKLGTLTVHGERIADIAIAEPEQSETGPSIASAPMIVSPKVALSARSISFRYSDNEPMVIAEFDFDAAPGECVAIAGPSGAGKSTLLKILAGLLHPSTGTVLIDDVPIRSIGLDSYRAQIGCVLQEDRLFAGSIAANIACFYPSPDPERIQQVAKFAAIHEEIIRMPMGYETLVGAMGSSLSGGQVQRIVMARALYRNPRILLLDEATSHLDEENERAINDAIRTLTISRVIVAHRRSTLDMADRIVPLWPATIAAKRVG
ncbi:MAG: ATP-binding cassette, subfamily bacterial CvaB/MchF/RaxB [Alphaproteobacteria bacterium]|jgi:ATP-binding cassette subfamily B protein RaxB|nr:ATP-binding cassette, subfamily bacterial CvaB/MchF/RaxB [Alphaproteobacteria bacterium]